VHDDTFDEFSFLPVQAAEAGVPTPAAKRLFTFAPDGRPVSALRDGDGEPEVTLLHGAGLNAHTWDRTVLALGRPALAIDLPGHGDSALQLTLSGDELIIRIGAYRRHILLPEALRGGPIKATREREHLIVRRRA